MTIQIALVDEEFAKLAGEPVLPVLGRLLSAELTQADGLLSERRRVIGVQALSGVVAKQEGLPEEEGVPIRVYVAQEEVVQDGSGSA